MMRLVSRPLHSSGFALLAAGGLLAALIAPASILQAQSGQHSGQRSLITEVVDESHRVVLGGNVHPLATRAADRGVVSPSEPAERMLLLLKRSSDQETALRAFIESLHDSNSPNFHKWLTPEQFGAQWGAADQDVATVTAWLESHGLKVAGPSAGRTVIEFSGTVGQIDEAFHTSIHTYLVNGETHHANATNPEIPAALAPVVAGVTKLNDFHPKSQVQKGPRGIYDTKTRKVLPDSKGPHPELTAFGSDYDFLYVGPSDAAIIYDSPNKAYNPAYSGTTIDGTGATIGIVGDSDINKTQSTHYRKLFGLPAKSVTYVLDGGTDPGENGDAVEAYLDTQVSNGLAPGAKVYYYEAANTLLDAGVDLAALRAVNDNIVDILSESFGECEAFLGTSANEFYASIWQQAAAQGISVTVSSGDAGSAGCDNDDVEAEAIYGMAVNGLASTPYNIAVGGTDFPGLVTNFTDYVSTTNDPVTLASAKGYIPEVPWNDSNYTFPPTTVSLNSPNPSPYQNIVAGGGGRSNCAVGGVDSNGNPSCKSGYAKPSWQSGLGVPADNSRDLPDLSLYSANGFFYGSWAICTDRDYDSNGNPVEDCVPGSNGLPAGEFYIYGVGGTSASAPATAGILALVRQSTGGRLGQADYVLYNLARNKPAVFHDITTGNNSVNCTSKTLNCTKDAAGHFFEIGENTTAGYDLASGLGSVDVAALISNWASAGLGTSTTSLTLAPTSIQHGNVVVADATVTASSGTATGLVSVVAESTPGLSIGSYPLNSTGSTGNLNIDSLPGGSYNVVATYGGSTELSQSTSTPVAVTVTPEPSTTLVSVQAYNPETGNPVGSYPYGYPLYFTAQPYGNNSPVVGGVLEPDGSATGTVAFTIDGFPHGTSILGIGGVAISTPAIIPGGLHTVAANYHGDNSFDPSTGTDAITITKGVTKLTLTSNSNDYTGTPIIFTVDLSTVSIGAAPTGRIELKKGGKVLAKGDIEGAKGTDKSFASGTVAISTSDVPPGRDEIVAEYLGDNNYAASKSAELEVHGRPSFGIDPITVHLTGEHTTAIGFIPVVSLGGFAGTVNLTCKLVGKNSEKSPPECAMYPGTATLTAGSTAKPGILFFGAGTTLPSGTTIGSNRNPADWGKWLGTGGAVMAFCVMFGIPARRKAWRAMLSGILLLVAVGGFTACVTTPKFVSSGVYYFQITGVSASDATNVQTGTVTVDVN